MLILIGFRTAFRTLGSRAGTCRYCHQFVPQHVEERANKLTLFFIPLFTTSRRYDLTCSNCGTTTALTRHQKNALTA
jgi:zinc-ribbon family